MNSKSSALSPVKQALLALEEMTAKVEALERVHNEPIAIIGLGCRLPGAPNPAAFWRLLRDGRDVVGEIPQARWNSNALYHPDPDAPGRISTRWGGFLDDIDHFDPEVFGISPREAASMDPQQRLLLEVAWEAFEHAGQGPEHFAAGRTGVFLGLTGCEYEQLFLKGGDPSKFDVYFASGIARSVAAGRIAYVLGMQGPNMAIDTACSSSLVAVHTACLNLRSGDCRMALAGGANVILSPELTMAFSKAHMMAADGRCKAFDAAADGFVRAEGCGIIVLKRLSDAIADGDRVMAVIRGSAVNQDGRSSGLTAPSGPAQENVIREALAKAKVQGCDIDYVETHGTGTALGDPIEAHALREVLGANRAADHPLAIGSVKTNTGHLEAAAGVTGLMKVVLSLENEWIPAHLHFTAMNPHIDWRGVPVEIPVNGRPWPRQARRRLAGISSFGFSGTNAHVIVEEAPIEAPQSPASDRPGILTLSARTETALRSLAQRYAAQLSAEPELRSADVCYTANTGRTALPERLAVVGGSTAELASQLQAVSEGQLPAGAVRDRAAERTRNKIVFLFSGQGTQYAGMGRELYDAEPVFRAAIDECEQLLAGELDVPLTSSLWGQEAARLGETQYTQPCLFALEWALAQLWRSWGVEPTLVLGHSVGEYVAACVAGVYSLAEGIRLIAARGRLIGSLPAAEGTMAAILAPVDKVQAAVAGAGASDLGIAAVNGPENVVVSGSKAAVEATAARFERDGYRTERLRVSHAFHSSLMEPIEATFEAEAARVSMRPPNRTLISSVTGKAVSARELSDPGYWRRQVRQPVQFHAALESAKAFGGAIWVEIGPGTTLLGLTKAVADGACLAPSLRRGRDEFRLISESLAALWVRGISVNWEALRPDQARRVPLPTYPFERQRYWLNTENSAASPLCAPAQDGGHPLLGTPIETARGELVCQTRLSVHPGSLLADHVVHGASVLPATAYLEMLAAAASESLASDQLVLERVAIDQALTVGDTQQRDVQTLVAAPSGGAVSVEICSRPADGGTWIRHASASVAAGAATGAPAVAFADLQKRCPTLVNRDSFYRNLRSRGLAFGSSFLGLQEIRSGNQEALGRIEAPDSTRFERQFLGIHPAVLDACIQTLAAAAPGFDPDNPSLDIYMPVAIDRIVWSKIASPNAAWISHAWFTSAKQGADRWIGNVAVSDGRREVLRIEGLHLKRAPRERLQIRHNVPSDVLYEIRWEKGPNPAQAADLTIDPPAMNVRLKELSEAYAADEYEALNPLLDRACTVFIVEALQSLGWNPRRGERTTTAALTRTLRIQERYVSLLNRLLGILAEDGFLTSTNGAWEVARALEVETGITGMLSRHATDRPDAAITMRCGANLAPILRGEADPLEFLYPKGQLSEAAELYTATPVSKAFNSTIGEMLASLASRVSSDRPVRVLEIGAGTGGTTTTVLPYLPADRTEYTFTDLGQSFVERAKRVFGASGHQMSFQVLDIEKNPAEQGVPAGAFDILVASNVLHATADLATTLGHARKLLRDGGALVVFECIRPQRWFDLTFGLTDGWWRFVGRDRQRSYTLLDVKGWDQALQAAGFRSRSAVLREDAANPSYAVLTSVAAQAADEKLCLVFEDETEIGERLASRLQNAGRRCVFVHRGNTYTASPEGITIRPDSAADYVRMLQDAEAATGTAVERIVHLWAAEERGSRPDEQDLQAAQSSGCRSVLYLAQALASHGSLGTPCWIATSSTQAVESGDRIDIPHSTIWGLVRALAAERPESRFACIDLEQGAPADEAAERILLEMLDGSMERQVAYRSDGRFVARLEPQKAAQTGMAPEPVALGVTAGAGLSGLTLRPQARRAPGAGEVEIEVRAAGLNFRDVLNAIGMRADADALGGEASGVVTRVGAGVTTVQPGDAVLAIAPGAFASLLVAPQELVLPKPERMTFADAATIPLAFLTADHCLREVGELRRGERILIHAAAGGVGLAAVQIALATGAEVFATAGSAEKREFLASLGLVHVFDSRSLSFADEVLERTGGEGVDVVLNSMSGEAIGAGLKLLRSGGRFLEIGKTEIWDAQQVAAVNPHARYFAVDLTDRIKNDPKAIRSRLIALLGEMDAGILQPLPRSAFALQDAAAAFQHMARARHIGKVLLTHAPDRDTTEPMRFREDGWYLLTGGLRGLGVEVARWMAERGAKRLALMSRRPPSPEVEQILRQMQADGVQLRIVTGDVSRQEDVRRVLAGCTDFPVRGVIHMAGVLDDALLEDQTWERFDTLLGPKMRGAWHLHTLTRAMPLEMFVVFSSVASVLGSPGQANHGAANAFLDALAHYRKSQGLPAVSINWGPWAETGAAAGEAIQRRLTALGLQAFSIKEGLNTLERALTSGSEQVTAISADWQVYLRQIGSPIPRFFRELAGQRVDQIPEKRSQVSETESLQDQITRLPEAKRQAAVEASIETCARRVLGLRPDQAINPTWPLTEMGMDSLMAVELRNAIGALIGMPLPATLLFDYPTVTALGEFLMATLFGEQSRQADAEAPVVTAASMLDDIEQLSDEEVERLLLSRERLLQ